MGASPSEHPVVREEVHEAELRSRHGVAIRRLAMRVGNAFTPPLDVACLVAVGEAAMTTTLSRTRGLGMPERDRAAVMTRDIGFAVNDLAGAMIRARRAAAALATEPPWHEDPQDLFDPVAEAIAELPPREQRLLTLLYQFDCGLDEAARTLSLTPAEAEDIHQRAVAKLRAHLFDD